MLKRYFIYSLPSFFPSQRLLGGSFALWCLLAYSGFAFGQSTDYHYGSGSRPLVIEGNSAGSDCKAELVVPLPGGVLVRDCVADGGATSYRLRDHLGSPRVLVDSSGSISGHCSYDAYGVLTAGGLSCAYTGYELDSETGLYRTPTRFYGAQAGRFTSVDPVPESWTPYSYAGNRPTSSIDPSGGVTIREITQNVRGEFLPNPEGIVLHSGSRRVRNIVDSAFVRDSLSERGAKVLDNFLAIHSEEFFHPAGPSGSEDVFIFFPDTVNISGIRYLSINMHGAKNGAIFPFVNNEPFDKTQVAHQLLDRLHFRDPRYAIFERTIMEQLEHISCQTCYGAETAKAIALTLSMMSTDPSVRFSPNHELSIAGSPNIIQTILSSEIITKRSIRRMFFDIFIGSALSRNYSRYNNYNRKEIARGNIPRRALERGDFKRYTVESIRQHPVIPPHEELDELDDEDAFEL